MAIILKGLAQPLRDGDDDLPVGDLALDLVPDNFPELLNFLLVATRAEGTLLATEGDQVVVSAVIAVQAGDPATQVAAGLEGVQRLADLWAKISFLLPEPWLVVPLKCFPVILKALPQLRGRGRRGR